MKQTQTSLEQQIAELTAKHNLQTSVESKLPGMEVYTNDFNHKNKGTKFTFTVYLNENTPLWEISEKIDKIIKAFPPSRNNCLMFAGKDDHQTASPFLLSWKNNIRSNDVQIQWISGEFWAHISLPIAYYSDDVKGVFMRKVYDSEYHYFGGVSMAKINKMQIRAYKLDMFESCKYYGGDVINFIDHEEDKEEFESVVLKGHVPEFADFWQKQLSTK